MTLDYSIIIPVYNGEKYLPESIASCLKQTLRPRQIILVDDGSTDSSGKICDRFAAEHDNIKVVHKPNGGLSDARNAGVNVANTEWIIFLDADDILAPEAANILSGLVSKKTDMAIGGFTERENGLPRTTRLSDSQVISPFDAVKDSLYQTRLLNSAWGKLLKTRILKQIRFTEGILYEDLDFFYRYCLKCREIAVTDTPIMFYRQHSGSIIHTWTRRRADVLDVTDRIETFMSNNIRELLPAARDRKFSANYNIYLLATANGDYEIADRCWKVIRDYRYGELTNRNVRLKNKVGAILAFLGRPMLNILSKWAVK